VSVTGATGVGPLEWGHWSGPLEWATGVGHWSGIGVSDWGHWSAPVGCYHLYMAIGVPIPPQAYIIQLC
jgi:hypothetical protein